MLNLNRSDVELKEDILQAEPAPFANWFAPVICMILTLYLEIWWRHIIISTGDTLSAFLEIIIVLIFPVSASFTQVRDNGRFKNRWGIVFVIWWVVGQLFVVALDMWNEHQYQNARHLLFSN